MSTSELNVELQTDTRLAGPLLKAPRKSQDFADWKFQKTPTTKQIKFKIIVKIHMQGERKLTVISFA